MTQTTRTLTAAERALIEPEVREYLIAYAAIEGARERLQIAADRLSRMATAIHPDPRATFDPDTYTYHIPEEGDAEANDAQ
jgi:hypothetical protein